MDPQIQQTQEIFKVIGLKRDGQEQDFLMNTQLLPSLNSITIYPIKSLSGVSLNSCHILKSGALENDRRWALFDEKGAFIQSKNNKYLHHLKVNFNSDLKKWSIYWKNQVKECFIIPEEQTKAESCLSDLLHKKVSLKEDPYQGYPDDTQSDGPTLISTGSLLEISTWFPELSKEEIQKRLRMNLVIDAPPFWEDRLAAAGKGCSFQLGGHHWLGQKVCQRCVVPTRSSTSDLETPKFIKTFKNKREQTLPAWSNKDLFNHYYRVGINTKSDRIKTGIPLEIGNKITLL